MATWDFRQLQQNLSQNRIPKTLMLVGEDDYLQAESLKLLKSIVLSEGASDFNFDQYFANEVPATQIRDTVEMLPMMSPLRLIVLRQAQGLKEKDWQQLMPLLENPVDTSCFVVSLDKVDKRKKVFKQMTQRGQVVELKKPYDNQVPAWIDYIAHSQQVKLEQGATQLLHQLMGSSLSELNLEIKKLKQFVSDNTEDSSAPLVVTEKDVLKVVSRTRVDSVFELTEAIGRRDRGASLVYLANLLGHGQSEIATLALIARHLRVLSGVKAGLAAGVRGAKLSAAVGVPNFFLQKYIAQAQVWSESQIEAAVGVLHETDRALKSSPVSSHIWLENFIIKTCS